MSKIFILLLSFVTLRAMAADRDPLLMRGHLGDGVAGSGWALEKCVEGQERIIRYPQPKISYTIENTKKNGDSVVQLQVRLALGETKIIHPRFTKEAAELKKKDPEKFRQACGDRFYGGYVFGGVMSIARKLKDQGQKVIPAPLTLESTELEKVYEKMTNGVAFSGTYIHMNPINEELLSPKQEAQKILLYAQNLIKNKERVESNIQPITVEY